MPYLPEPFRIQRSLLTKATTPAPGVSVAESKSRRVPLCPACGEPEARHLDGVNDKATVDFFDCDTCHHLWAVDKHNPSKVSHITPLPPKRPAKAD